MEDWFSCILGRYVYYAFSYRLVSSRFVSKGRNGTEGGEEGRGKKKSRTSIASILVSVMYHAYVLLDVSTYGKHACMRSSLSWTDSFWVR